MASKNRFVWTRVTQDLRNGGPLEMLSIAKPIKIKVLLHQFSLLMLNLRYIFLLKCFLRPRHSRHSGNAALYLAQGVRRAQRGKTKKTKNKKTRRSGTFLYGMLFTLYESFAWQIFASLGLFTFARIACLW